MDLDDFGQCQLVDRDHNWIVAGARFDLDLDDVTENPDEHRPLRTS